ASCRRYSSSSPPVSAPPPRYRRESSPMAPVDRLLRADRLSQTVPPAACPHQRTPVAPSWPPRIIAVTSEIRTGQRQELFFEAPFSVTGANAHYGTPVNPRAPDRLPGGSSSGSAASTAAGACDFALGSDSGGSVRVPAAFCGLYGIRPTHGRIDMTGAMAMAPSFDVAGWFASGAGVFRRVGEALLDGGAARADLRKLIIVDDAFAQADAEVADLLRAAIDVMARDLPAPVDDAVAPDGFDPWRESFRIIQAREIWSIYGPFVEKHQPKLGPGIRERMEFAATVSQRDADTAREEQKRARERIRALVVPGTVLA